MVVPFLSLVLLGLSTPAASPMAVVDQDANTHQAVFDTGIYAQTTSDGEPVCLKIRSYIFERNDGAAPKLMRETTCWSGRPRLNRSKMPKARVVPAK